MKKLYIFDVDGTTVKTKSGQTFRQTADDWEFLPDVVAKCKQLREQGAQIGLASNQNGVAFPWSRYTEVQIQAEIQKVADELGATHVAVCYKGPNPKCLPEYFHENDPRRKPNPGMIDEIRAAAGIDKNETLFIGDRDEDEKAAINAGVAFAWAKDFFAEKDEGEKRIIIPAEWPAPEFALLETVYDVADRARGFAPQPGQVVGLVYRGDHWAYLVNFTGYSAEADYGAFALTREPWEASAVATSSAATGDDFDPFLELDDLP